MPFMRRALSLCLLTLAWGGCIHIDPIEIHAVVDINVKVDKALDDFFGDIDKKAATLAPSAKS
jgi:hypothetical protein